MLTLYHIAPSRSSIVLWMMEEIGQPYELKILDSKKGENREPAYLAVNPMGKAPALVHDDVVITELAAICCYLADAFPQARLAPPIGDSKRGLYLKWLFFAAGPLESAVADRAFKRAEEAPRGALGYGDYDTTMEVVAKAVTPGPFLLGESFTAADLVLGSHLRWASMFKLVPDRAEFKDYIERFSARPALQRAMRKDQEIAASQAA